MSQVSNNKRIAKNTLFLYIRMLLINKAENHKNGGLYITDIDDNEYLCVRGVDFGKKGAKKFSVSAACVAKGAGWFRMICTARSMR